MKRYWKQILAASALGCITAMAAQSQDSGRKGAAVLDLPSVAPEVPSPPIPSTAGRDLPSRETIVLPPPNALESTDSSAATEKDAGSTLPSVETLLRPTTRNKDAAPSAETPARPTPKGKRPVLVSEGEPAPKFPPKSKDMKAPATGDTTFPPTSKSQEVEILSTPKTSSPASTTVTFIEPTDDYFGASLTSGSIYGDIGVLAVQPVWQRNPAAIITNNAGPVATRRQVDFPWDVRAAPEATFGYKTGDGLGFRVHGFQFDQSTRSFIRPEAGAVAFAANPLGLGFINVNATGPDSLRIGSGLALTVADFDVTQDVQVGRWNFVFGGGARYAHMSQDYSAYSLVDIGGNQRLVSAVISGHSFNGAGPSALVEARRSVGSGAFGIYGSFRGSLLFGSAKQVAHLLDGNLTTVSTASQPQMDIRPNAALEVGAEYNRTLGCRGVRFVLQVGLHGQIWWNAGNSARSTGVDLFDQSDSSLGLIGVAVRTGFQF